MIVRDKYNFFNSDKIDILRTVLLARNYDNKEEEKDGKITVTNGSSIFSTDKAYYFRDNCYFDEFFANKSIESCGMAYVTNSSAIINNNLSNDNEKEIFRQTFNYDGNIVRLSIIENASYKSGRYGYKNFYKVKGSDCYIMICYYARFNNEFIPFSLYTHLKFYQDFTDNFGYIRPDNIYIIKDCENFISAVREAYNKVEEYLGVKLDYNKNVSSLDKSINYVKKIIRQIKK